MRNDTNEPETDVVKLRVKIGVHEFEAEGPRDLVTAQFEAWKQLAGLAPASPDAAGIARQEATIAARDVRTADGREAALRNLFAVDAKQQLVTLRVRPTGQRRNADAALLLLYGYRSSFAADEGVDVPAARLKAALLASGHRPKRLDRAIAPHVAAGLVRKGGRHKHETYALTTPGCQHAAALARKLLR
jgi:hypothetical protein